MSVSIFLILLSLAGGDFEKRSTIEITTRTDSILVSEQPVYRRFKQNVARRHDRGLMFRSEIGAVGVTPTDFEQGGLTLSGSLSLGGLPWSRVALHGSLFGWGTDQKGAVAGGPGITFWFSEDGSIFLSAAAGPTVVLGEGIDEWQIQLGGEIQLGLYKWTSDHWSLGGSLVVGGESFDLDGDGSVWGRARGGLRIGASFN